MQGLAKDHVDPAALAADPRWRSVAAGLKLVLMACVGLMLSFGLFIALASCVILWRERHPWLVPLTFVTLCLCCVACAALCLAGMALCCRVPIETGGRRLAQAALVSLVVGLVMFLSWQVYDPLRYWFPPQPYRYAVRWALLIFEVGTVLVLAAAAMTWGLFIAALAGHLGAGDLCRNARRFAIFSAVWSGSVTAHVWFDYMQLSEHPVGLAIIVFMSVGAMASYGWLILLLELTRLAIVNAASPAADEPAPPM
jgi:hypothetical protein